MGLANSCLAGRRLERLLAYLILKHQQFVGLTNSTFFSCIADFRSFNVLVISMDDFAFINYGKNQRNGKIYGIGGAAEDDIH